MLNFIERRNGERRVNSRRNNSLPPPNETERRTDGGERRKRDRRGDLIYKGVGRYREIETEYNPTYKTLTCFMKLLDRPSFTPALLKDLLRLYQSIEHIGVDHDYDLNNLPIKYVVQASRMNGVYNYGGDLKLFTTYIRNRDKEGLYKYARSCIDALYHIVVNFNLPIITIALVEGDAFAGGFEMALANDLIIADERAKFGMTEKIFNLFPGMGAYSFLSRRLSPAMAEKIMLEGKVYTANQLFEMGLVDIVAAAGTAQKALHDFIEENVNHYATRRTIYGIRHKYNQPSYNELLDITSQWVNTAFQLSETDLRRMERLVAAQIKKQAARSTQ